MTNRSNYDWSRWASKQYGPQPTEAELAVAHAFGKPGKQSLALALAMRKAGATQAEIKYGVAAVFDCPPTPHNNHRTAQVQAGLMARDASLQLRDGVTCHRVTLTERGEAYVARRNTEASAKRDAAKASKAKTPRKPKAVQPEAPPAPAVTEAAPAELPAGDGAQA